MDGLPIRSLIYGLVCLVKGSSKEKTNSYKLKIERIFFTEYTYSLGYAIS